MSLRVNRPWPRTPLTASGVLLGLLLAAVPGAHAHPSQRRSGSMNTTSRADAMPSDQLVVLWEDPASGWRLSPLWRQTLAHALRDAAAEEQVALCLGGDEEPGMGELCGDPAEAGGELWWKGDVELTRQHSIDSVIITLNLELRSAAEVGEVKPATIIFGPRIVLPPDVAAGEREQALARRIRFPLSEVPALRDWFADLTLRQALWRPRPPGLALEWTDRSVYGGEAGERIDEEPLYGEEEGERAGTLREAWLEEQLTISKLLLDGDAEQARDRASDLLAQEGLDEEITASTRELLERAQAQLAAAETAAEPPGPEPEPPSWDFTFRVRASAPGGGFSRGSNGNLRIWDGGLRFTPDDPTVAAVWETSWRELEGASRAEGLWDVRYPLEVRKTSGERLFIAAINRRTGRYESGETLLATVGEGLARARGR